MEKERKRNVGKFLKQKVVGLMPFIPEENGRERERERERIFVSNESSSISTEPRQT